MANWVPALMLAGIGALLFYHGRKQFLASREADRLGQASMLWPQAPGRITASSVENVDLGDGVGYFFPEVAYTYTVAGEAYTGKTIAFRDPQASKKTATAIAAKYPVASNVSVSFDPNDPRISVLEPGTEGVLLIRNLAVMEMVLGGGTVIGALAAPLLM